MAANKRVCETSAAPPILNLPYEITHQIIDLCRPGGFEAVALTCKHFFAVAQPLVESHEACKRQVWTSALERNRGVHSNVILRGPHAFLEWLITLPEDQQIDQLRYFRDIIYVEPPPSEKPDNFIDRARDLKRRILDRILDNTYVKSPSGQELVDFEFREKIKSGYPHLAALIESAEDTIALRCPADSCYGPEFVATFTDLRSLVISSDYGFGLPNTIRQLNGYTYFQNLEELYIIKKHPGTRDDHPNDILSLCMLPKLRVLMFSAFSSQFGLTGDGRKPINVQKLPPTRALLESLAVKGIENRYEDLHHFFARLPKIRSLLWEDAGLPRAGVGCVDICCRLDEDELKAELEEFKDIPEPDPDLAIRAEYPELYSVIDRAEQEVGEDAIFDTDCAAHVAMDWPWRKELYDPWLGPERLKALSTTPTDILFKPSVLLHQIILAYADRLEHLAILGLCGHGKSSPIQRKYKILHFRDLPRVKYLEFDTNVVRPRKGEELLLPSLQKLLPSNVEVVSVVVRYPYSQQLAFLCQGIVEAKLQGSMRLRRIIVKDAEQCVRLASDLHSFIERFKDTLAEVGITIEWRPIALNGGMNVTMDWENPKVVDDFNVEGLT